MSVARRSWPGKHSSNSRVYFRSMAYVSFAPMEILSLSRIKFGTPVQPRCVAMSAPLSRRFRSLNWSVSPRRCIYEFDLFSS